MSKYNAGDIQLCILKVAPICIFCGIYLGKLTINRLRKRRRTFHVLIHAVSTQHGQIFASRRYSLRSIGPLMTVIQNHNVLAPE